MGNTKGEAAIILVVDDDEQVLKSLCALVISSIGYDCLSGGNRFEAVEILKKSS